MVDYLCEHKTSITRFLWAKAEYISYYLPDILAELSQSILPQRTFQNEV